MSRHLRHVRPSAQPVWMFEFDCLNLILPVGDASGTSVDHHILRTCHVSQRKTTVPVLFSSTTHNVGYKVLRDGARNSTLIQESFSIGARISKANSERPLQTPFMNPNGAFTRFDIFSDSTSRATYYTLSNGNCRWNPYRQRTRRRNCAASSPGRRELLHSALFLVDVSCPVTCHWRQRGKFFWRDHGGSTGPCASTYFVNVVVTVIVFVAVAP